MSNPFTNNKVGLSLYPVLADQLEQWLSGLSTAQQKWLRDAGFNARAGELCSMPGNNGELQGYAFGMADEGW